MDLMSLLLPGALVGAVWMILMLLLCLAAYRGSGRRWLLCWVILLVGTLGVMTAGNWVLGWFGLALRSWVMSTLGLVLVGGWIGMLVQTTRCYRELLAEEEASPLWRGAALTLTGGVCTLVVVMTLWVGLLFVIFSVHDERVVSWEGQRAVEQDCSWLHPDFRYYAYHGPLVQGSELLGYSKIPVE